MPPETAEMDEMSDAFMPDGDMMEKEETTETETREAPESVDEEAAKNPTALIPVSALGKNVRKGDSVTLKVVSIQDEEAMVEISSGEKKSKEEPMSSDDELDSMSKGY